MEYRFVNQEGKVCSIPWPPQTLTDVERLYRPCGDDEEDPVDPITLAPDDVLRFSQGEATGAELGRMAAGDQLHQFALDHLKRHPGCGYREALEAAKKINPELVRAYAGVGRSVEEDVRRAGSGAYSISDGAARVHVRGGPARTFGSVGRADLLAPGDGIRVRWTYLPGIGEVPDQITFSKVQFPSRGRVDVWLQRRGLVPAGVEERFDAFVATLFDPAAPSPDRVQYAKHEEIPQGPGITGSYIWPAATEHAAGARHLQELLFDAGAGWTRAGALAFLQERGLPAPLQVEELLDAGTETVRAFRFIFHLDKSGIVPR